MVAPRSRRNALRRANTDELTHHYGNCERYEILTLRRFGARQPAELTIGERSRLRERARSLQSLGTADSAGDPIKLGIPARILPALLLLLLLLLQLPLLLLPRARAAFGQK